MAAIQSAGIDYLSMTVARGYREVGAWSAATYKALELIRDGGNVGRPGSYQGYDGLWVGGAFTGEREDGVHCHIPGAWAGRVWAGLHQDYVNYSRLDLQVTYQFDAVDRQFGPSAYHTADLYNQVRPLSQQRKVWQTGNTDGGYTLYIGAKTSKHFCRLYDKAAQSDDEVYERCWRYEIELHNDAATAAARYIWTRGKTVAALAASTVWRYYHDRGIECPWTRQDEDTALQPQIAPRTDIERKLEWLRSQVRPTIRLLRELIPRAILDEALGNVPGDEELPVQTD